VCLAFGLAIPAVRAADQPEARAVVDKAIKAMGRDKPEARKKGLTWKGKGKIFALGDGIEFSGEWIAQMPDKNRGDFDLELPGMKLKMIRCIDGDKGWQKVPDGLMDMDKDEIVEEQHMLYANWVAQLYPLTDQAFELSKLADSKVDGRPVVGVKVARKGRRDVNLYLDKDSSLLLRMETRGKDTMAGGKEVTTDVYYSEYKDTNGIKDARKFTVKQDGKMFLEFEYTDFQRKDKLDDNAFKP
jgi:hypothetical protein